MSTRRDPSRFPDRAWIEGQGVVDNTDPASRGRGRGKPACRGAENLPYLGSVEARVARAVGREGSALAPLSGRPA